MNERTPGPQALLQTALHSWHAEHGARLVDFAGWHMPLQYSSIIAEHNAVRSAAGLFDVAHMGRIGVSGIDAAQWLDGLVTQRCADMSAGRIRYALLTNERGGTIDDVLVYRLPESFLIVCNAANRERVVRWLSAHIEKRRVGIEDRTLATFMLALQGPRAIEVAASVLGPEIPQLRYYHAAEVRWNGQPVLVSRTGYTGEDGIEAIVGNESAVELWEALWRAGADSGLVAAGLGCRDTLRLEAGMPLYGHELTEEIDPLSAGLGFAVCLEKDFIGRDALRAIAERGPERVRVGLRLQSRRIARQGCPVFANASTERVGVVTSGTFSPTLQESIAMAYVARGYSRSGTPLEVEIRGRREPAVVSELPFYARRKQQSRSPQ